MSHLLELRPLVGPRPLIGVSTVIVVRDPRGRVLLQRRRDTGRWSLPGGHLDLGESLEQCARRELAEETGLTGLALTPLTLYSGGHLRHTYPNGDVVQCVAQSYLALAPDDTLPDHHDDESAETRYFAVHELPDELNSVIDHLALGELRCSGV